MLTSTRTAKEKNAKSGEEKKGKDRNNSPRGDMSIYIAWPSPPFRKRPALPNLKRT
jgi:hypothetical protein